MDDLRGKCVSVIGLGRFGGGLGATRWLCAQGARVTVSDAAPKETLAESLRALDGLDVTLHLGGHRRSDFLDADLLVVNPAVPRTLPLFAAARAAQVPWTTEMNLFLQRCRAPIVGITGSVGKSTTTAMAGDILRTRFVTHLGGNIGRCLLEDLHKIRNDHLVVLELSSFQLEDVPQVGISPRLAVVTNLAPNHLDRHGTMDAYATAKKNIFRFQRADSVLVLNAACPVTSRWADDAPGQVVWFNTARDECFELTVPGEHNQANAQAAWAVARQFGVARAAAADALRAFPGLPHRIQFAGERGGVRYFNDSKCTTPEGAIVALNAFAPRTAVVIVGGYDKHVSFDALGAVLADRAKAVVACGATREAIASAVEAHRSPAVPRLVRAETFEQAVTAAMDLAEEGDVVLLSPACASFDMFANYEQRGERFIERTVGGDSNPSRQAADTAR